MNGAIRETSSIGATWPPAQATHNRVRGFYPEVVDDESQIDRFLEGFEAGISLMDSLPEVTRLSIRLVANVAVMSQLESIGVQVEAAYPLSNLSREAYVVYTCKNASTRQVPQATMDKHARFLSEEVLPKEVVYHEPRAVLLGRGYEPRILHPGMSTSDKTDMVPRFMELYGKFGFSKTDVKDILTEPSNTIAYLLDSNSKIVSTSLAERVQLEIDGIGTINITEISEAATLPELEGQGLYRNLSGLLVRNLIEVSRVGADPIHALYGETNLSSRGVVHAARRNGRRFSAQDAERFGIKRVGFGILEQNFKVNDGHETREYNDFALTYVEL